MVFEHVYSNVYVLKDFFLCNGLETFHEVIRRVELVPRDFFSIGNAHKGAEWSFSKSAVTEPTAPPSGVKPWYRIRGQTIKNYSLHTIRNPTIILRRLAHKRLQPHM